MKQLIQLMKFIIVVFLVTTLTLVDVGQAAISSPNAPVGDNLGPVTSRDTIYQIVTDRFVDGNSNNNVPEGFDPTLFDGTGEDLKLYQGGDFAGIVEKIPYLKEMGITAVWISAPYSNRDTEILDYQSDGSIDRWTSFHGYHARNFFETNQHFGSMRDFMDMKNELQNNGIKVVLDFVSNHTSRWQNPTIGNVPEDGQLFEPNRDENGRYMFDDDGEPTVVNGRTEQLLADPNGSLNANWFYRIGDRGNDESRYGFRYKDLGSLASFNHENPAVIQHLDDAVQFWVNTGIDGIRHDATLHLNPAFMKGFKQRIDSNNNGPITQFGEFFIGRPDQKYDEYVSFPDRTGVNNLDFEWYRASANTFGNFSESMSDFGDMLVKTEQDYSYENQAVTFLDNHDVTRFRYTQQNDRPYHAGIVALMTSRGIPNIYYGTEQYLDSDDASDIAGRVFMERETEFNENTVAFQTISSLAELRQQNPAIAYGLTNIRHSSEHVLVYERSFYDYTVVVAINRHPDEAFNVPSVPTQLPNDTYEDVLRGLLDGQSVEVSDGQLPSFELSGGASAVWSYNNHSSEQPMIGDVISTMGVAGDRVHLYGENLSEASVWFGDVEAEVIDRGDQELVTLVPTGLDAGDVSITLQSGATTSNAFTFHKLSGEQTQVVFNIEANTNFGETIHVVGNIPELGSWDADRSTEAFLNPEHPYWFLPVSVPINEEIEYKFIKKNEQGDVIWESGTNRTLDTPSNFSDVKFTETDVFQN